MKISGLYQSVSGLVAGGTLLVSCFLFSGCNYVVRTKTLFGEELDKFPSVVLSAQNHSTTYVFDWNETTLGGVSLSEFKPKAKYWRLHLFKFSNGDRIAPYKTDWKLLESDTKETFEKLTFDTLMLADLDLTDNPVTGENARRYSINVLLHDE